MLFDNNDFLKPVKDECVKKVSSDEISRQAIVQRKSLVEQNGLGLLVNENVLSPKQLKGAKEQSLF